MFSIIKAAFTGSIWNRYELVLISFVFTRDMVDPVRIESAFWYQMGPLTKVIPYGTISFQLCRVPCKQSGSVTVDLISNGSERIRSRVSVA